MSDSLWQMLWSLLLGDLQKLPGHRTEHPAMDVSAGTEVGADRPRGTSSFLDSALNSVCHEFFRNFSMVIAYVSNLSKGYLLLLTFLPAYMILLMC